MVTQNQLMLLQYADEDNEILNTTGLSCQEITGHVEVFNIRNNKIEMVNPDGEYSDM